MLHRRRTAVCCENVRDLLLQVLYISSRRCEEAALCCTCTARRRHHLTDTREEAGVAACCACGASSVCCNLQLGHDDMSTGAASKECGEAARNCDV